jgi:hypothetical protein
LKKITAKVFQIDEICKPTDLSNSMKHQTGNIYICIYIYRYITSRHSMMKLTKAVDKEQTVQVAREKQNSHLRQQKMSE